MPLIELIAAGALDEEYVEVAARRTTRANAAIGGSTTSAGAPRRAGIATGVGVAVVAVLITMSFQQTRDNEDVADAGRATLEDRIRTRRDVVSDAQGEIARLRAGNAADEATLDILDDTEAQATLRLGRLRAASGFAVATGEGVRIELGDNPDGLPRHRVYDEDLALLTNGLWEAGATAIAVNGHRLTVLSSFRFSGQAIRLNDVNVSLSPPYTVLALGDTATLAADLLDTTTGLRFQSRAVEFGFSLSMHNEQRLTVPAAPQRVVDGLRSARSGSATAADDAPTGKGDAP